MKTQKMERLTHPDPGEIVAHCDHLVGADIWDWLLLPAPWTFKRPDGSCDATRWIVLCVACFECTQQDPDPAAVVKLIRGDSVWEHGRLSNGATPPGTGTA